MSIFTFASGDSRSAVIYFSRWISSSLGIRHPSGAICSTDCLLSNEVVFFWRYNQMSRWRSSERQFGHSAFGLGLMRPYGRNLRKLREQIGHATLLPARKRPAIRRPGPLIRWRYFLGMYRIKNDISLFMAGKDNGWDVTRHPAGPPAAVKQSKNSSG